ncbi:MAG: transglutaminase domain-containing protein [Rudaea sp.]|uniref:transglutaminase-like domain-containing protein n=1 Tax=unclassified Rudaea TaxID=2627037 RepID=UPI001485C09F|nr:MULTISPECIES: transglutaminase-like domain-containing protein [unclassified Rudaea]MBN8887705.1 transglutaminase domain-containing protein [Rudaea sp.]
MLHRLFALLLLSLASVAQAAPPDETWMSVLLDGRKIGHMHTTRTVAGASVRTVQTMQIEIERSGLKVGMSTSETDEETSDGKPLRFESRTKISGIESVQTGVIRADGKLEVTTEVGGAKQTRVIDWPRGAVLAEGLRLAEEKHGLTPGSRYKTLTFQAENLEAVEVDSRVADKQTIELPDGKHELVRIEQVIELGGSPTRTVSWVEADFTVRKLLVPMMGYELTMLACPQACATAPNQASDILVRTLLSSPRALSAEERANGVSLVVSATDASGEPLQFATTDEQQVSKTGDKIQLRIAPLGAANTTPAREAKPTSIDTQPNDWLQSAAPEVVKLAHDGAGAVKTPAAQMQSLEDFVRKFIRNKDLSVGYASALEVAKNPEGDCTEHAVLLAALGRVLGIPTRVVDGLVYIDSYAGKSNVFVPHAWAQAYVDGRWRSYDAALQGFDAGHIALSTGSGDPWRFYAGFNTLGRVRIDSIEPLRP